MLNEPHSAPIRDSNSGKQCLALVIGIDDYPYLPAAPLLGCRHDAERMSELLVRHGFVVERLMDSDATREAVLSALDAIRNRARPGDRVVVHWSGHGSRVVWPDGQQIETLVPHDSGRGAFENRDIADLEVRAWLREIAETTPFITLFFDSCHAGGAARDTDLVARVRSIEDDRRPVTLEHWQVRLASRSDPLTLGQTMHDRKLAAERYALFAACRAGESAKERRHPTTGKTHGAFTLALTEAIDTLEAPVSHRDVFDEVGRWFEQQQFSTQNPQLEGARDRELFGIRELPPIRFAPVVGRRGHQVDLAVGDVHRVVRGSTWRVVPRGMSTRVEGTVLGTLKLVESTATRSRTEIVDEVTPGAIAKGDRAIEITRPAGDCRMAVCVAVESMAQALSPDPSSEDSSKLRRHLTQSALLRVVEAPEESSIIVRWRSSGSAPRIPCWISVDRSGRQVMGPMRAGPLASLDRLKRNLESLARHRALWNLTPPGPDQGGLLDVVQVELLVRRLGAFVPPSTDADGVPIYEEGESLGVRMVHQHDEHLFLAVLDLGLAGAVELLYPVRGAWEPIEPGREILVGVDEDLVLGFPDGYPYPGDTVADGEERILVLATTREADFDLLRQQGARSSEAGEIQLTSRSQGMLAQLLRSAIQGGERDVLRTTRNDVPDRWGVERRSLRLRSSRRAV